MKILEVCRSYYPAVGGLEKFVKDRNALYEDIGFEVDLVTTDYLLSGSESINDAVLRLKQYTKYNLILKKAKLIRIMKNKYDVVSVNQIGNFLSDFILSSEFISEPVKVLTPHYYFHTKKYSFIKNYYSRFVAGKILERVDYMICFTKSEAEFWSCNFNFPKNKIHIIPHYVNYDPEPSGIHDDGYLLFIGRNAANKRLELLLQAWKKSNIKSKLIVAGSERSKIEVNNVEFKGIVSESEKRKLLRNCSALILATDHEAFAHVLMEASAFKKPILCSNLKLFGDVLNDGGYFTFKNDVNEIITAVKEFESLNREEKVKMGEINFINLERYEYGKVKNLYKNFFESIL